MFSGIVSVIPWKDHFIQLILQFFVFDIPCRKSNKEKNNRQNDTRFTVCATGAEVLTDSVLLLVPPEHLD